MKQIGQFAVALLLLNVFAVCVATTWSSIGRETRLVWLECSKKNFSSKMDCLKVGSARLIDEVLANDVVPLTNEMRLVRTVSKKDFTDHSDSIGEARSLEDGSSTWVSQMLNKLLRTFRTHVLQIDLQSRSDARHRRRNQTPMMFTGILGILMFLGFNFLAALAGKSFLMAKLALLLASVNGLRRVANSGVAYGLYHSAPDAPYHSGNYGGFYERDQGPRHHEFI